MKRTLRLVGVAAMVLLLAASCKKEEKNNGEKQMMTFSAGIEQTGAKTGLLPNGSHAFKQVWKKGDAIRVNDNETVITLDEGCDDKETGTFTGEVTAIGKYYAVYPTSATLSGSTATFTLPESQKYDVDSYESDLAPMADYTENNELNFRNLCGLMELSLTGTNVTVTSLELSCDKPICGTATYNIDGSEPLAMANGAGNMVSMDCSTGVPLNGTASFIFVLPPVGNGHFSLVVNYKKGDDNVFVETVDLTSMNISIKASEVSYNNTAYEIGNVTTKGINESGASVGATTATILYTVDDMAGYTMSESGVCYGMNENPDLTNHQTGSRASSYTASLSGLSPNTHYYARAYAKYSPVSKDGSDVVVYGNQIDFYTQSIGGTVTTDNVSSITATGASLGYSVAPNTGSQATQHGVCYSTNQNPSISDPHTEATGTNYAASLTGLNASTKYYVRAYAIFAVASKDEPEVVYGNQIDFTTQSIGGTVTTGNVSSITATGASVGYSVEPNAYSQATRHGVCYSTSQNPSISDPHTEATGSTYTASLTGLNASMTYYVRAYAVFGPASKDGNSVTVYGEQISFPTSSSSAPDGFVDFGTHVGGFGGTEPLYWAKCNVGANNVVTNGGDYFMWGHAEQCNSLNCTLKVYGGDYKYEEGENTGFTKYCSHSNLGYNGFVDYKVTLDPTDDAATKANSLDRMPSKAEWEELVGLSYRETVTSYNGVSVKGCIIYKAKDVNHRGKKDTLPLGTYTINDTHIFLPAGIRIGSGNSDAYTTYWSRTRFEAESWAYLFDNAVYSDNENGVCNYGRHYGMHIRPVREQNP